MTEEKKEINNAGQIRAKRIKKAYFLDYLLSWLPVILVFLMALSSWWLLQSVPVKKEEKIKQIQSGQVDYFMENFSIKEYTNKGILKSELAGQSAQHYPTDEELSIKLPIIKIYGEKPDVTTVKANRGVSNKDGSEIKLFENVNIIKEDNKKFPIEFSGEYIHAFVNDNFIKSDKPVEIKRGRDKFTGNGFDYDEKKGVVNLIGNVHGVIMPRR